MHKTRREFLDDFLAFVGEANDPTARDVAERALNRVLTGIWLTQPWRSYRSPAPFQITLVANQRSYSLPDYFGRLGPGAVRNVTTGGEITPLMDGELERVAPEAGTTLEVAGYPGRYEIMGTAGVHTQPVSTGDPLEAVSSSAADTDVVVTLGGDNSTGRWTRTSVTLTGLTPVALGTWAFLDECGKAFQASATAPTELTSSRGTVTIRKVAGAVELQALLPQESAKEHQVITFYKKPDRSYVVAVPVIRKPKRLLYDSDPVPDLWEPALFEELDIQWRINTGEIKRAQAGAVPRSAYIDLVQWNNEQMLENRRRTRPFGTR